MEVVSSATTEPEGKNVAGSSGTSRAVNNHRCSVRICPIEERQDLFVERPSIDCREIRNRRMAHAILPESVSILIEQVGDVLPLLFVK